MTATETTDLGARFIELGERRTRLDTRREELTAELSGIETRFDQAVLDGEDTTSLAGERRAALDEVADLDRACGPLDREITRVQGLINRARDEAEHAQLTKTLAALLADARERHGDLAEAIQAAEQEAVAAAERIRDCVRQLREREQRAAPLVASHRALSERLGLPARQWSTDLVSAALGVLDRETLEYRIAIRATNARGASDVLTALMDVLAEYVRRANGADLTAYLAAEPGRLEQGRRVKLAADAAEQRRLVAHSAEVARFHQQRQAAQQAALTV